MSTQEQKLDRDLSEQPITIAALIPVIGVFAGGMIFIALTFPRNPSAWSIWAVASTCGFGLLWRVFVVERRGGFTTKFQRLAVRGLNVGSLIMIILCAIAAALPLKDVSMLTRGQVLIGVASLVPLYVATKRSLKSHKKPIKLITDNSGELTLPSVSD